MNAAQFHDRLLFELTLVLQLDFSFLEIEIIIVSVVVATHTPGPAPMYHLVPYASVSLEILVLYQAHMYTRCLM